MSTQVKTNQLRGMPIKEVKKRIKVFIYGGSGTGKSFFCTQFPSPYYIDTEKGVERSKYVENISKNNGVMFQTRSFADLFQEVKTLATVKHEYQTLVIDPITPIYNNLLDECLARMEGKKAGFGQHYQDAGNKFQKLIDLLLTIDMNVVVTAHSKDKYGSDMSVIGTTYDAYKKLDFLFDVVIETITKGNKYFGISRKSRIISLEPNKEMEFSYQKFHELYEKELQNFNPKPIFAEAEQQQPRLQVVPAPTPSPEKLIFREIFLDGTVEDKEIPLQDAIEYMKEKLEKVVDHLSLTAYKSWRERNMEPCKIIFRLLPSEAQELGRIFSEIQERIWGDEN